MSDLVLSSVLFSLSFGLIKAVVAPIDPFMVAFLRLAIALAVFSPRLRRSTREPDLLAIGFVQYGVMYCLYIASFRYLAGHQVAILTTTIDHLKLMVANGPIRFAEGGDNPNAGTAMIQILNQKPELINC